ncbi:SipW-dependent-type signal peptide-containing protein [Isoptericola sp. NPDC056578]|uniref:SipW-dependent-type signal peptide-containing protein n=1 Tax=Isoptericola sp. NPDC056578 TaxID=3345870 RepID=UPI0036B89132
MNTRTKGIVAGVAGAALLLGAGGTFALWHDQGQVAGGVIRAGHLKVQAEETQWFDVSPDRGDAQDLTSEVGPALSWDVNWLGEEQSLPIGVTTEFQTLDPDATGSATGQVVGHQIDLGTWQAVPGDFVLGQTRVMAYAEGDNMEARLSVHGASLDGELAQGLGLKFFVTDQNGNVVSGAHDVSEAADLHFPGSGMQELRVFVLGNLPRAIDRQDLTGTEAVLQDMNVMLEQIR